MIKRCCNSTVMLHFHSDLAFHTVSITTDPYHWTGDFLTELSPNIPQRVGLSQKSTLMIEHGAINSFSSCFSLVSFLFHAPDAMRLWQHSCDNRDGLPPIKTFPPAAHRASCFILASFLLQPCNSPRTRPGTDTRIGKQDRKSVV